jgi:AcrR family transcriptional regulator
MNDPKPIDRLIRALLDLTPAQGWSDLSLRDIAAKADLTLAQAYQAAPSKLHILQAYSDQLDQAILAGDEPNATLDSADQLFDVIMRRFDAMLPDRAAFGIIYHALRRDPAAIAACMPAALKSLEVIILCANLRRSGVKAVWLRIELIRLLRAVFLVWLAEEDAGQSKTMAELDRRVRRLIDGQRPASSAQQTDS